MRGMSAFVIVAIAAFVAQPARGEGPPAWAYPVNPPDFKPHPDDGKPRSVPGSTASYTVPQTRDRFLAPVWHPGDHPALPDIVAHGRKPDVFACGFCHRANGQGGPENADLAGLPASYIIQQMADYKNGMRGTAVPNRAPQTNMIALAKGATDAEIAAAAAYFSSLKPRARMRVVETDMVPKTHVAGWFLADEGKGEKEPIGNRIIEVPEDVEQFENRDSRARFVAYVPPGSVKKGEALVASGNGGKTAPCGVCHGATLQGLGPIPGLAGRSPSYITRQLYEFQHGVRTGAWSPLMSGVVAKLSEDDLVSISAYLASLEP
jgi:cytochrome c553